MKQTKEGFLTENMKKSIKNNSFSINIFQLTQSFVLFGDFCKKRKSWIHRTICHLPCVSQS